MMSRNEASPSRSSPTSDLCFTFPATSPSTVRKPVIRQVEQTPRGARPRLKSLTEDSPTKGKSRRKGAPPPLELGDENRPVTPSPISSKTAGGRRPLGHRWQGSENSALPPLPSTSTEKRRRPLPRPTVSEPSTARPTPEPSPVSAGRSVRPLPALPSSSSATFPADSPPIPCPVTSPTRAAGVRPLPRPPCASSLSPQTHQGPPTPTPPSLSAAHQVAPVTSPSLSLTLPDIPPLSPIFENTSYNASVTVAQPNSLLKSPPLLQLDVSPKTLRRLKGAAISATEIERSIVANMFRPLDKDIPDEFFCENILARTGDEETSSGDDSESCWSLITPLDDGVAKRNTFISVVNSEAGYEINFQMDEHGEEDDEEEGEIVTWEHSQLHRYSKKWVREKDGVVVEENYENVIRVLRSL